MSSFCEALDGPARASLRAAVEQAGFASFGPSALTDALFSAMLAEADAQRPSAWGRAQGDTVDHRNQRANLGPVARGFLTDPHTLRLLGDVVGAELVPSFEASCYTYYEGPNDFLAPHVDRPGACAYTLIVYVAATWPQGAEPGPGMELQVFDRDGLAGAPPRIRLATRPNVLVIGRGAESPHGRPALREGERVAAMTACYAVAAASAVGAIDIPGRTAVLVDEGYAEYQEGHLADARERFETALQLDPMLADAWSGLGFVEWTAGEFLEALHMYMTAVRYNAGDASTWSNIGLCLRDLKELDRAENAFAVALMLDPDYAPALNEWANVLQDQGRVAESVALYMRALALDPSRAVVHHNLGVAYTRLQERTLAALAFSAALERDPNYVHALEELGLLCASGGLVNEARAYLTRAGTARAGSILESLAPAER